MRYIACVIVLLASGLVPLSHGAKILAVFSMGAHSHFTLGFRLAKELADRGHEVTFINAYPQKKPIKNLKEISVEEIKGDLDELKKELYEMGTMSYIGQLQWVSSFGNSYTESVLKVKEVQKLLQSNEQFDLVLIEHFMNEAMAIFQHKFKCPSVVFAPGPPTVFNNHLFANPSQPAYVPNLLADFGSDMSLWERILNVYYDIVGELYVQLVSIPNQNAILQRTVPGAPDLRDILYNASFLLLTSHISVRDPSPIQPNMKEIAGYHLLPPTPLPRDLQEFLDSAKEGAIIFSMGSNLKSADFPQAKKEAILKVFSRLKQKVLWKFETDLPGKPDNVKIVHWLPQQDALAHPNVVAFITHVGLLGKQYRNNAKMRSRVMHDQPVKQIDEAMFWIEYVIRHKGALHYRSPALNLKWYQRLLLDVILILAFVLTVIAAVISYIVKIIFKSSDKNVRKNKRE